MKALRNTVQLIGHVGQEPEIKTLDGGKKNGKHHYRYQRGILQREWR